MTFKQMMNFMLNNDINESEYVLLCSMYYRNLDEEIPDLIKKYAKKWGVVKDGRNIMFDEPIKEGLLIKGMLVKDNNKYRLTNKFLDLFVIELVAGNELIDYYPSFIVINNIKTPLKTSNRMELRKKYWEIIGGQRVEHMEVMKDIHYGKQQNMLNMNISKFIESEYWRDLRTYRLEAQDFITTTIEDY